MPSDDHRLRAVLGLGQRAPDQPRPAWRRPVLWGLAVGAGVVGGMWALAQRESGAPAAHGAASPSPSVRNGMRWWSPGLGADEAPQATETRVAETPAPVQQVAPPADAGLFRLDGAGQLVLDEQTRLGVESLVALTTPEQMHEALEAHVKGLPPKAAAAARELVGRYESYVDAQKSSYPPGRAPLVPEEGLAELAGLQALRESYFGREAAQRMFEEEDAVAQRLLELMREDPVPDAPMEDKAVRAQARYDAERDGEAGGKVPVR